MWMVKPGYQGHGLGYKMFKKAEDGLNVIVSLGVNVNTAVPIYRKKDFLFYRILIDMLYHLIYINIINCYIQMLILKV